MKNKNIFISIGAIVIIDILIGRYIFTRVLDYQVVVTCWITLLAGSVGGIGTLIAVGLSNSVARKQLESSIIYKSIEEIKELIEKVLNINNLVIGLEHLDVVDKYQVEEYCNKLIDAFDNIRADVISIRNIKLREEITNYFTDLNIKVCSLKYSETDKEAMESSLIIQSEMLNVQGIQVKLEKELERMYLELDKL